MALGPARQGQYSAELACGNVLFYDSRSFRPAVGEQVPCLRHDYCRVTAVDVRVRPTAHRQKARSGRRTREELLGFLQERREATIADLRRSRFTLRLIAHARADGSVVVDGWDYDAVVKPAGRVLGHAEDG